MEIQTEIVGCSNPDPNVELCKKCLRNSASESYESFNLNKPLMSFTHVCDGYVNKNERSLF